MTGQRHAWLALFCPVVSSAHHRLYAHCAVRPIINKVDQLHVQHVLRTAIAAILQDVRRVKRVMASSSIQQYRKPYAKIANLYMVLLAFLVAFPCVQNVPLTHFGLNFQISASP
jgi:hypothetical protein